MLLFSYEDILKDGTVLCRLINKISPGSVKKIADRGSNFQLMENIQRYFRFLDIKSTTNGCQTTRLVVVYTYRLIGHYETSIAVLRLLLGH